jgi:hypothetical protein
MGLSMFFLQQQCLILDFVGGEEERKKKVENDNVDNDYYFHCANDKESVLI